MEQEGLCSRCARLQAFIVAENTAAEASAPTPEMQPGPVASVGAVEEAADANLETLGRLEEEVASLQRDIDALQFGPSSMPTPKRSKGMVAWIALGCLFLGFVAGMGTCAHVAGGA